MRSLLATCILIGAAAVAAPHLFSAYLPQSSRASAERAQETGGTGEASDAAPRESRVEIDVGRDGHFYVDAEVNFTSVRLMVDTGATVVALRESDAELAGIRPLPSEYTNPVQTANGTTMAAEAQLGSLAIDDVEVRNVRALIIPDDQLSLSLLGGSFLNNVRRFEVADGRLIIEN